jgi:hypothetical protein
MTVVALLAIATPAASATSGTAAPKSKAKASARGPRFQSVTFGIRHRVFHEFRDLHTVKLNEDFPLGDSEYSARVTRYLPDFQMDLHAHKIFSMSNQPRNPAFQVIVRKNKVPQDTSWAFLKSPPHFGARSYFAFQVLRIDFVDHEPLVADTSATAAAPTHSMPAPAAAHGAPAAKDSVKVR